MIQIGRLAHGQWLDILTLAEEISIQLQTPDS
jgi:hypothetical protein